MGSRLLRRLPFGRFASFIVPSAKCTVQLQTVLPKTTHPLGFKLTGGRRGPLVSNTNLKTKVWIRFCHLQLFTSLRYFSTQSQNIFELESDDDFDGTVFVGPLMIGDGRRRKSVIVQIECYRPNTPCWYSSTLIGARPARTCCLGWRQK